MSTALEAKRFQTVTLWIFAAVGFLASVVAIYGFFAPDSAQLQSKVYVQTVKIPREISVPFSAKDDDLASFGDSLERISCGPDEGGQSDKPDLHVCNHGKTLKRVSEKIGNLKYPVSVVYEISLTNTGNAIAKNIQLDGSNVVFIDVYNPKGTPISLQRNESRDIYNLPDLNPNDSLKLDIWSSAGIVYNYDGIFNPEENLPSFTYSDGRVATSLYVHAPESYYGLWEFLRTFPAIISVFIVIVICFLVAGGTVVVLSVVVGVAQGKALSTIFATPADKVDDGSAPTSPA